MIEYRIIPITRYMVTRYEAVAETGKQETIGEFPSEEIAYRVGAGLTESEAAEGARFLAAETRERAAKAEADAARG